MEATRINILIPKGLADESQKLIKAGLFSNISEMIREGLRHEIIRYEESFTKPTDKDKELFELISEARAKKELLTEKEMEKYGLKL